MASTSDRPLELVSGARLGPYVLLHPLGTVSGLAQWEAERREGWAAEPSGEGGRRVELVIGAGPDRTDRGRFFALARALAVGRPPGWRAMLGVRRLGALTFAVRERASGCSLAEALADDPGLSSGALAALARDLASALAFGWNLGVVVGGLDAADVGWSPAAERAQLAGLDLVESRGRRPDRMLLEWLQARFGARLPRVLDRGTREDSAPATLARWIEALEGSAEAPELRAWWSAAAARLGRQPAPALDPTSAFALPSRPRASAPVSSEEPSTLPPESSSVDDPTHPEGVEVVDPKGHPTEEARLIGDPTPVVGSPGTLDPPTLSDATDPVSVTVEGASPSPNLPALETATEIDEGRHREDATAVALLDAFRSPGVELHTPTGAGATPSDPLARFDALRVPSRSEIAEAVRGVPTLALASEDVREGLRERTDEPTTDPGRPGPATAIRTPVIDRATPRGPVRAPSRIRAPAPEMDRAGGDDASIDEGSIFEPPRRGLDVRLVLVALVLVSIALALGWALWIDGASPMPVRGP